ncbi:unnamed protein product [Caenorhabditis bovis]|uniref:Kinesin-like protein n=1 Tax=Caenorhabditis bovis TaxID=2654633 RepID=A0A8S1F0V6_9PELO|nr:unnamed protein product [Caenorhabditis bovis]
MIENVRVAVRLHPSKENEKWYREDAGIIAGPSQSVPFDLVFDDHTNQDIFNESCKLMIESVCDGFNASIAAYGQSGSGKTFTVVGKKKEEGLITLAVKHLLNVIEMRRPTKYLMKMGALEVYNENVYDLLSDVAEPLRMVDDKVSGALDGHITCYEDFVPLFEKARLSRKVSSTKLNQKSSRSHAIFSFIVESYNDSTLSSTISRLLIVDLAGSENARVATSGSQSLESKNINLSLLALNKVISNFAANPDQKIATYRESKLTRLLKSVLGGNSRFLLICCVQRDDTYETRNTIKFGQTAKCMKNSVSRNVTDHNSELPRLLQTIKELEQKLEAKEMSEKKEEERNALLKMIMNREPSNLSPTRPSRRHSIAAFGSSRLIAPKFRSPRKTWNLEPILQIEDIEPEIMAIEKDEQFDGRISSMSCDTASSSEPISDSRSSSPTITSENRDTQTDDVMIVSRDEWNSLNEELKSLRAQKENERISHETALDDERKKHNELKNVGLAKLKKEEEKIARLVVELEAKTKELKEAQKEAERWKFKYTDGKSYHISTVSAIQNDKKKLEELNKKLLDEIEKYRKTEEEANEILAKTMKEMMMARESDQKSREAERNAFEVEKKELMELYEDKIEQLKAPQLGVRMDHRDSNCINCSQLKTRLDINEMVLLENK